MTRNYLFQNNNQPLNYQIIDDPYNSKRLIATTFNSEIYQIVYLLIGNQRNASSKINQYQLYNWNITSNLISLNYQSSQWNCSIKCEISATGTFFLLQNHLFSYLYLLDASYLIVQLQLSYKKNSISILDQSNQIRKKSDINRKNYIFASGKDLLTLTYTNKSLIVNIFPIPLIYNFNPNNFVLDAKLYQNKLYILYRSIVTYNIYLYEFQQIQLLFKQYPNNTKLNSTGITIKEVFRFNNNYISKVIRFVRGVDNINGNMIIWVYNDNEAYKCLNSPCLGYGYQIYNNIIFSAVTATNHTIAFYGKSNMIELKNFKANLISEEVGKFYLNLNISLAGMISYSNYAVTKLLISTNRGLFPTVYNLVNDCKAVKAFQQYNFCECHLPYTYNPALAICTKTQIPVLESSLDTLYIAFIAICSVLLLTLIFIIYRKIISFQRVRKSWQYNAAQNIIFQ